MSLYGAVYRNVMLPAYEMARGRSMLKHLKELHKTQWLPAEEIERRQWDKLQEFLDYAYREVPFYRRTFDEAGLRPDDVRTKDDFSRLPFLEKKHLQENQEELLAEPYRDEPLVTSHSGGSTGKPVEFKYHREHYDRRCAAWYRADRWAGWDLGERQMVLWLGVGSGVGQRSRWEVWKEHLHWAIQRWSVITATKLSAETVPQYCEQMHEFGPESMYGLAQSVYTFALLLKKAGLEPPPMNGIILGAEKIFPAQKERIEEVFRTPTFERYGCNEFCNIAEECEEHDGMHINADDLYVEVVGPDGRPVPPGEVGEVVVTCMDNRAMPFIRYRLGDMGIMADGECPCGRGLPRIKEIVGRTCDMIVTPEGVVVSGIMMPHFMKEFTCIREFQFVQEDTEHLKLRLVPGPGWDGERREYLESELRRWIGPTIGLEFEESEELERAPSGKYRLVISDVPVEEVMRRRQ